MTDDGLAMMARGGSGAIRRLSGRLARAADEHVFVVLVLAAAGLFRVALLGLGIGSDTWYTLLGGRVVDRSWLPHGDTLAVMTHGREWVDQQWFAHLLLYGCWSLGGWPLALLVLLASFIGAFAAAMATALRHGASSRSTAAVGLLCLVLALGESAFRAQTLAYLLFALLLLLLLENGARPSRRVYLALPVLVVWANVHGSVVLGAALVTLRGLTLAWEARRVTPRAGALVVAPWLCTVASPYGFALPGYYVRLLHNPALARFVSEWQPATIKNQPVFFVVLAGGLLLVARRRRQASLFGLLALLATAAGGLLAVRHVVWFALTAAAVLPAALDELWPASPAPRRRTLNLALASLSAAVLVAAAAAYASHSRSWFESGYPARAGDAAAAAAARDPQALVFASERYADWLLFEHPALAGRVAYDARFELLTQKQLERIAAFRLQQGANWQRVADGYRIFVLDPADDRGAVLFLRRSGATVLYQDSTTVVLERDHSG